jgi:acetylglutamate kinase
MNHVMNRVIKIGGGILDKPEQLNAVLDAIARRPDGIVLVHGGGRLATDLAERLHLPQHMHEGRRITDYDSLQVVTMTYAGWINKSIVAGLYARGVAALGLCGADGDLIRSVKRSPDPVDFGFVGDPVAVNHDALRSYAGNAVPVIAPITHDGAGTLLNTNADTVAAVIARALAPNVELVFAFDHVGVLRNLQDPTSMIPELSRASATTMVNSGEIHSGMLPKLSAAFSAVEQGVPRVRIVKYDEIDGEGGTWIR